MKILPGRRASDVWNNDPPSPGTGFTQIQQLFTLFGGSRKVTFWVTPAGTTLGVTDPHSCPMPFSPSSATNNVACSGLLLTTVTFQVLAPAGTGPASGGNGVGIGVGVGIGIRVGIGRASTAGGGETPAGMYNSADEPVSVPPATRTVPSRSSVAEASSRPWSIVPVGVQDLVA